MLPIFVVSHPSYLSIFARVTIDGSRATKFTILTFNYKAIFLLAILY